MATKCHECHQLRLALERKSAEFRTCSHELDAALVRIEELEAELAQASGDHDAQTAAAVVLADELDAATRERG